ncbi:unnamed protein product [Polarella glacialis]|uniref:DEK-C domain-containing protein n=1 Tax=Polarella glacialis TaxID=89957 RepID=A0A813DF41_POLGL|nr:unnamed protein product [Polarella glacialis]
MAGAPEGLPSEEALKEKVVSILASCDLQSTSLKLVRAELEVRCGLGPGGLDPLKDKIKDIVTLEMERIQADAAAPSLPDLAAAPSAPASSSRASAPASSSGSRDSPAAEARKAPADAKKSGQKRPRGEEAEEARAAPNPKEGTKAKQASSMTKGEFMKKAKRFTIKIGDKNINVDPKQFSTGSSGFYASGKALVEVGGISLQLQIGMNCTVIGSKEWKDSKSLS